MHLDNFFHLKWIVCIETTLNTCGLSQYWLSQNVPKNVNLSNLVKQSLCDQFKQNWTNTVYDSPKCLNYRIFKSVHKFESYIAKLPFDLRKALCNFRCMNHRLPVEQGRFWGADRDDRIYVTYVILLNWRMNFTICYNVLIFQMKDVKCCHMMYTLDLILISLKIIMY
jgi:hypothetical protein